MVVHRCVQRSRFFFEFRMPTECSGMEQRMWWVGRCPERGKGLQDQGNGARGVEGANTAALGREMRRNKEIGVGEMMHQVPF